MSETPRGERNNNPTNLEDFGIAWDGMVGRDADGYCVFATADRGLRAGARDLHTKATLHKLDTLHKIIPVFAPKSENDVVAYERDLCAWTGWGPDEPLDLDIPSNLALLLRSVVRQECGRVVYSDDQISAAATEALVANAIGHLTALHGESH